MEKEVSACLKRIIPVLLSNLFPCRRRKAFILAAAFLFTLAAAAPADAAIQGFLARDSSGTYHQYNYEELLNSYALNVMGLTNGLYEDFAAKKLVALVNSSNGYADYSDLLDQYASALLLGNNFCVIEYLGSGLARNIEVPARIYLVSLDRGRLTSFEVNTAGETESSPEKSPGESAPQPEEKPAQMTPLVSGSSVSLSKARAWAEGKNAHQRFIDIAPLYWEYGKKTGLCPEVLYAQSALETGFGHYTGQVPPTYNNWAGIKTGTATGDEPEDHQRFDTPEDGVRAHFNHMSAYVGLDPIGEPHDRYHLVTRIRWAGTVTYVEDLSGKWAPSSTYHERILRFLEEMK